MRSIAFYLPQYHPIPENDAFWGKGFTEWTNVGKARPQFRNHYQPHIPADLGFYDLRSPESRTAQSQLALQYGIDGFCYYYYWFNGKRLLERPLNEMLASGSPDFPFCICWANENWTRRWDGKEQEILVAQTYEPGWELRFIRDAAPVLADSRYIKVNGRPMLLVYRAELIPDVVNVVKTWRAFFAQNSLPDPYLCSVQSFNQTDPRTIGFDAATLFPPGLFSYDSFRVPVDPPAPGTERFQGVVVDYRKYSQLFSRLDVAPYPRFECIMPSWDNTPRRGTNAVAFVNSTPQHFERWAGQAMRRTAERLQGDEQLLFINAWNEWGEGCHLEPDQRYGRQYLEAFLSARRYADGVVNRALTLARSMGNEELYSLIQQMNARSEKLERSLFAFADEAEPSQTLKPDAERPRSDAPKASPSEVLAETTPRSSSASALLQKMASIAGLRRSGGERALIFGASVSGERAFHAKGQGRGLQIVGFIDNDREKQQRGFLGLPVYAPTALSAVQFDRIIIASAHFPAIFLQLKELGFTEQKIDIFR